MEKDLFYEAEDEKDPFVSLFDPADEIRSESRQEKTIPFSSSSFIIELAQFVKNSLGSVRNAAQLSRGKFNDVKFEEYFNRLVTDNLGKVDSVLESFLNYIKMNTPVRKMNTVHRILEEVLKKYEAQLEDKKIKVLKKFESDLPETIVHDEQLRYILHSLLRYTLSSVSPNGSIIWLTKSFQIQKALAPEEATSEKDGRYVEIMVVFSEYKRPIEEVNNLSEISANTIKDTRNLVLRLVKEVVQKNKGKMRIEVDEKKPRTFISLIFPVERRSIVYYPSINANA
jgi:light-regulated signal transduction histidine kinase (bacteriophytochrome)